MPVFQAGPNQAPEWCELERFDLVELKVGQTHVFPRAGHREKLIVCRGRCRLAYDLQEIDAREGANVDLVAPFARFEVLVVHAPTTLIRMAGRWGAETGGSGIFGGTEVDDPRDGGDSVDYEKRTPFDNHYHDCDEYWIIFEGRGIAVSEGKPYEVGVGDCVATGMGHHHDLSRVYEPLRGAYFETTLEGQRRLGHLWEHTHGEAQPKAARV
jgi:mannose-6-phosphate isomerase-like protein (cupin superfamily)